LNNLKVSIITVCYNSAKTISDTIQSVIKQDYKGIEYIIIDGVSKDNTLEIIKAFTQENILVTSEKDHGLYDAMNKGIKQASGDIICFLHSDDFYADNGVISHIVELFEKDTTLEVISSSVNIYKHEKFEKPFRVYRADRFRSWQFRLGMQPPHPGIFVKKEAIQKTGFFNSGYKISADFDWILRLLRIYKSKTLYTSFTSVKMRDGGVSSSGFNSKKVMNRENLRILKSHGIYSNTLLIYAKYLLKIFQVRI
jgi:glycosyltransferase involved in cell wall biosynthesis